MRHPGIPQLQVLAQHPLPLLLQAPLKAPPLLVLHPQQVRCRL